MSSAAPAAGAAAGAATTAGAESRRDRLERLTNLMLVLLDTPRPLSLREITERVDGYPGTKESARQAFERDKKALRDLGIPVTNVPIDAEEQVGYVVRAQDYYLPELDLDEAEAQALAFAVAAVQLGGNAGRDALSTLGHSTGTSLDAPVAVLPSVPALGAVHEALRANALLTFRYRGRAREVEPYGLTFRQAAWYLVAKDRTAGGSGGDGEMRTFRVDRFESAPVVGQAGAFEPPPDFDLGTEIHLLPFGAEAAQGWPIAELEVDGRLARQVASLVPESAIARWSENGGVFLRLPVGDEQAFVSWVAGLGDTTVVRAPEPLRRAVIKRLRLMATEPEQVQDGRSADSQVPPLAPPRRDAPRSASPPSGLTAGERLRRLLAVLVHLARVGEGEIGEIARRFDMDEEELVHDLELAACCGVPPYTPDQLIELIVDGDRVSAFGLGHLAKPRRLTPEEGFALAAAAKALCEVAGADEEGALRSALSKLEAVLGESRFSMDVAQPEHLHELQEAAERHERVEIQYFSSAATEPTTREVDPYQVVLREGRWYLDGWCHLVDDLRRFQVDRVQAVRATGVAFDPPGALDESLAGPDAFIGGPDSVRARLAFPVGSELGVEQVALSPLEPLGDGRLATDVLVGDVEGWFGRLLLRLGPGTEVLSPPELRDAGPRAAQRALRRYGTSLP
ncbi:MAG: helix-turn-helix transcriptional regulator [Acidimicrobiales bacterium]|jgi:predicted DNA-binding transcriptional regulator YafY